MNNHTANEPEHDKPNKMACACREDSDQLGHPPILISLHCLQEKPKVLGYLKGASEDLPRLIRVFVEGMSFCWFCHARAPINSQYLKSQYIIWFLLFDKKMKTLLAHRIPEIPQQMLFHSFHSNE